MVDITAKLFWYRSKEWYAAMAGKLTDVVYTDESKETINVINLLLLGWILLGLVVYIIGTYVRKRKISLASSKPETPSADDSVPCATEEPLIHAQVESYQTAVPVCEGEDEELVQWVNRVIRWIYSQKVISPAIDAWLVALNARTRLAATEHGILVDFRDLLPTSGPPKITEVRQNTSSRHEDMNFSCDMEFENIAFEIAVTQFKGKEKCHLPFVLFVKRLFGKVSIECNPEDLSFTAKYSEPPQIQLQPEASNEIEIASEECQPLCDVVSEITNDALSTAIVPLRFSCFPDCPRMPTQTHQDEYEVAETDSEQKLLVKIIKATNLGGSLGCMKPYCVVEMDDPPQRFETQVVEGTQSPFWDEAFTFSVKDQAELLFEIYDKDKTTSEGSFLGLGIVGMEELMRNPSQRQIIPLQSRPLEEDDVTGALTAEFLFLDRPSPVLESTHFGPLLRKETGKTVETNSRVTAGGTVITTTTIKRTEEEPSASTSDRKSNTGVNPNSNLHATEELPHPETSSVLARNDEPACSEKRTSQLVQSGHGDQLPNLLEANTNDKDLPVQNGDCKQGLQNSNCFESLPAQNGESNFKDPVIDQEMSEPLVQNSDPTGSSIAEKVDKIVETAVLYEDKTSDLQGQIDEITPILYQEVEFAPQMANQTHDTLVTNCGLRKDPLDCNSDEILQGDLPSLPGNDKSLNGGAPEKNHKTVNKNIPVIKPPNLPTLLVEGSFKNGFVQSEGLEDLPTIAEEASNNVGKSMDGKAADLAGTALQELGKQHISPSSTSKSTLIIHSVHRPESSMSESLEASPARSNLTNSRGSCADSDPSSPTLDTPEEESRSRPKEKRSFMGTLRRRLSFHKARSKSAENRFENGAASYSQTSSRSASTDRVRHPPTPTHSRLSPFKNRRFLGGQLLSPAAAGSTRSSLSEASGISASTYINENSTLVIETNENGIIKRYLIPNSLVHRSKWKKRGTKLHIFNDHVFIAKHLSGSTLCQVCRRHLTRRPGKQGYECRGCDLQCHKSCHIKVENYCSNSSINSMEVEYIHDPKGASPKSI